MRIISSANEYHYAALQYTSTPSYFSPLLDQLSFLSEPAFWIVLDLISLFRFGVR
jgi:hypothetical protein